MDYKIMELLKIHLKINERLSNNPKFELVYIIFRGGRSMYGLSTSLLLRLPKHSKGSPGQAQVTPLN